jgi:LysM repeat protein
MILVQNHLQLLNGNKKFKLESMKKIFLLIVIFLFISESSFSQHKKYKTYTVKKGETIKSIAKYYQLSTRDLLRLNPGIRRRPKPNTVIIVPNKNYGISTDKQEVSNLKFYTVKPKETLFGISKKFNITIEALKKANPKLIGGLKNGMQLVIPKPIDVIVLDSTKYVMHKVIKEDTFYHITKKYNVTEEDLIKLNPQLIDGLKLGMVIKIKPISEDKVVELNPFIENIDYTKKLKLYFLLPYQLNKLTDSIEIEGFKKSKSLLNIATDFHLGAIMAIDSLRKKGLQVDVEFMDTENSKLKLQLLINKHHFTNKDIIIGPMFYENAYWLANHVDSYIFAPFYSKNQEILKAKNLIKTEPDNKILTLKLLNYIEENYKGENLVLINDDKPESQPKLWRIVNQLKQMDSVQGISVIKSADGYIDVDKLAEKMIENKSNWVLLVSNDLITTVATVNNLKSFDDTFDITLFALKKDRNFETVNNNYLGKLNFTYPSIENSTFSNREKDFFNKYKEKNYALPSKYAMKGFDITYDILVRLASSKNMEEGLFSGESSRIKSKFYYVKNSENEIENEGIHIIQIQEDLIPKILKL